MKPRSLGGIATCLQRGQIQHGAAFVHVSILIVFGKYQLGVLSAGFIRHRGILSNHVEQVAHQGISIHHDSIVETA